MIQLIKPLKIWKQPWPQHLYWLCPISIRNSPLKLMLVNKEFETILLQEGRPITFFSRTLAPRHWVKSTYEKELTAVMSAMVKWRHDIQSGHFNIKTDHFSFKYLLEQKITRALQQKSLTKPLELDYDIQCKKGSENKVDDTLSRKAEEGKLWAYLQFYQCGCRRWKRFMMEMNKRVSQVTTIYNLFFHLSWKKPLLQRARLLVLTFRFTSGNATSKSLFFMKISASSCCGFQKLITELTVDPSAHHDYTLNQGILSYKGKIYAGKVRTLRKQI